MKTILAVLLFLTASLFAQTQHGVTLSWNVSSDPKVAGNNVYQGTVSHGPYTKINSALVSGTTYSIPLTNANSGIQTFFVVTAVGTDGVESGYSNEVSATFLVLPQPPTGLSATSQ